jgi:Aldo/keto reductase family
MNIPFAEFKSQYAALKPEIDAAILSVLDAGWFVLGEQGKAFEKEFGDWLYTGSPVIGGGGGQASVGRHERNKTNGRLTPRTLAIANEAKAIAEEIGASTVQVALRWLLEQPGVVSPIVGARTAAQLEDSLSCFEITLTPEHFARLEAVSAIELGFPQSFLKQDYVQKFMSGNTTIVP